MNKNLLPIELSSVADGVKPLTSASLDKNFLSAISGDPLGTGVIKGNPSSGNGDYHIPSGYIVGQAADPMMLDNGSAYNIVVYSYGTTSLPIISSGEQNNLSSAVINYDDTNRDFMPQEISFTIANTTNHTLNITLRHKVAQITAIVNSGSLGNITAITGGLLTPQNEKLEIIVRKLHPYDILK